jgi:chemotaxis protein methyltransferase CheR
MDADVYGQIKFSVKKLMNIDLDHYKEEQMRRRLDSWLVRSGSPSWPEYIKRVSGDNKELSRFRDYLTINVSEFFRDMDRWQNIGEVVLPQLIKTAYTLRQPRGGVRIWSAGCSIGAEPYTLSILLDELAPTQPHYLLATDLDRGVLAKAKARGPYTQEDIKNVSPARKSAYFDAGGPPYFVKERTGRWIEFREHNLLSDPFGTDFDLIVCRNVVIYFTTETKSLLYQKFYNALRPGGILFLGGTEIIPRPQEIGFHSQGVSMYVKG